MKSRRLIAVFGVLAMTAVAAATVIILKSGGSFDLSEEEKKSMYSNPLSYQLNTADPCVVYSDKDKCYYGIYTGNTSLILHRAKKLKDMFNNSESVTVYRANEADETYGYLWAPELHYLDGKWYIYTSTHGKDDKGFKHVICLKAKTDDPFDGFELGAHLNRDVLGIDPTVYRSESDGRLWLCFSVVDDGKAAVYGKQSLAIQEMSSPTEVKGAYTVISSADYPWEMLPPNDGNGTINEGAYFIENDGRLFIAYSANGCWNNDYVVGLLEFTGGDMLSASSWKKQDIPFLRKGNGNYGPGHATFFRSPDKTELWICFHCLHDVNLDYSVMARHCHCQRVEFDGEGYPVPCTPLPKWESFEAPSGE